MSMNAAIPRLWQQRTLSLAMMGTDLYGNGSGAHRKIRTFDLTLTKRVLCP